ncbi:alpha/beta fold hydrolase [Kibdelosporangium phytohabitans]|uniref:Hydrolase n=1 Tax=Kibdelosporangium phytohabitans TaxID=860235 RepID=A0A0N9I7E6_9PSEU|nr:alpha/beta hydrolase [Kibdelosporangium phytohabitans]ALG10425.1 hydrolase [Kibdelosporangium phytohabitans]MBE1461492.1 pimeloyl-ACP methyl ester carboxylesterase [Kibdelosporangium phytohabitans]
MTTTVTAGVLEVPDARLHYEVRGAGPTLVLVGAPMDATAFAPIADLMSRDFRVVTTDPRGIRRSRLTDPDQDSTPELRADDLSRLLTHLDAGPAAVFGSSGGAVTALALVQAHPEQVHTLIAHEPPVEEMLEDRDRRHANTEDVIATYLSGDVLGAWQKFFTYAGIELPEGALEYMFGRERDAQSVADERYWFAHELRGTDRFRPDIAALRASGARLIVGIGAESTGQSCDLTSRALAAELGIEPTIFPGDHTGFADDPDGFAPRLRAVLSGE